MYTLHDTFNNHPISRHRTLDTAVRAQAAHSRAVRRAHGRASYIPTAITDSDDNVVAWDDIIAAQYRNGL